VACTRSGIQPSAPLRESWSLTMPDEDSGFDGLAILLWPVLAVMRLKVWLHNKIHPDNLEEL
jgi:hypothetical protein